MGQQPLYINIIILTVPGSTVDVIVTRDIDTSTCRRQILTYSVDPSTVRVILCGIYGKGEKEITK